MATSKKDKLKELMGDFDGYQSDVAAAEWAIYNGKPALIKKLKALRPTKEMLEEYGYDSLSELIEYIEETLN